MVDYNVDPYNTWYGIWAGQDTDPAVAQILSDAISECLADEAVAQSLYDLGIQIAFEDFETCQATIQGYWDVIKGALIAGGALTE